MKKVFGVVLILLIVGYFFSPSCNINKSEAVLKMEVALLETGDVLSTKSDYPLFFVEFMPDKVTSYSSKYSYASGIASLYSIATKSNYVMCCVIENGKQILKVENEKKYDYFK